MERVGTTPRRLAEGETEERKIVEWEKDREGGREEEEGGFSQ